MSSSDINSALLNFFNIDRRKLKRSKRITLHQRRIYILPTRNGILFSLLLFVMLVGAINYNNSMGFLFTFLMASLGMVSIFHTYRNIAKLTFRAGKAEPVYQGDLARFNVIIDNTTKLARHGVILHIKGRDQTQTDIKANSQAHVSLSLPSKHRGWLSLPAVTVETQYPLGMFRAWSGLSIQMRCLVYPKPGSSRICPDSSSHVNGKNETYTPGNEDFMGFRSYYQSDSPRHVDWKAAARSDSNELLTKLFSTCESDELLFDWDSLGGLDTEARLSQLCRWVIDAETSGKHYGLRLPNITIETSQGEKHKHRCLETLALY